MSMSAMAGGTYEYVLKPHGVVEDTSGYHAAEGNAYAQVAVMTMYAESGPYTHVYENVRNINNQRAATAVTVEGPGYHNIAYWANEGKAGDLYKLTMQTPSDSSSTMYVALVFVP